MESSWIRPILAGSMLWLAAATGVHGQIGGLSAAAYSGVAIPAGGLAD